MTDLVSATGVVEYWVFYLLLLVAYFGSIHILSQQRDTCPTKRLK